LPLSHWRASVSGAIVEESRYATLDLAFPGQIIVVAIRCEDLLIVLIRY
jgi:hypothetical protein